MKSEGKGWPGVALVTGATGYVGLNLAAKLAENDWHVHIMHRPHSNLGPLKNVTGKIKFHVFDGSSENLLQIMRSVSPSTVFHLASLFISDHQTKDIQPLIESNLLFGTQLVDSISVAGTKNLVNTGTSWQHYNNQYFRSVNLYAATKQAFEAILQYYADAARLKITTLKLFDTYGPSDPRPKLLPLLSRLVNCDETLDMSPGEQLIDLVYIDDVVAAYMQAAKRQNYLEPGTIETFAVSSGKPIKIKELVEKIESITSCTLPIRWGGRPYRGREVMVPWSSGESLPGWQPEVTLVDGLGRLFARSNKCSREMKGE